MFYAHKKKKLMWLENWHRLSISRTERVMCFRQVSKGVCYPWSTEKRHTLCVPKQGLKTIFFSFSFTLLEDMELLLYLLMYCFIV